MKEPNHIDRILKKWSYDPDKVRVRLVRGDDGRQVIQMRVDLGLLQLETTGRPDGLSFEGKRSFLDFLRAKYGPPARDVDVEASAVLSDDEAADVEAMDEDECAETDREFMQFYHRRICWLQLRQYDKAVRDADHTLELMDFCREHSPDEQWTLSHEQYRPFVLYQRTQAAAMAHLEQGEQGAEAAIIRINEGLDSVRDFFDDFDVAEQYDENEFVQRLTALREELRQEYRLGMTLQEQLDQAVASEDYELAAQLRDEIAKREFSA
ncbi:MAG TPA: UvrB/UvrC motif-containing protein [Pirellulaceae bacterium]|jgi:tetratricopeptide (TPR) repeat protein|nr:UvrB/UvrC motif-containing protein [Pirellulaceae bacterium]